MVLQWKVAVHGVSLLFFGILLSVCFPNVLFGESYAVGAVPTATLSYVATETTPGDRNRLEIGIKETVTLSIANWVDSDDRTVGSETNPQVDSVHGDVSWTWSGTGSCSALIGDEVIFTAGESDTDTSCEVTMRVKDNANSQFKDDDITRVVTFSIKKPAGITPIKDADLGYGAAGNNFIGAKTRYWLQIDPPTVSFKNVEFRRYAPSQTKVFPNTTPLTFVLPYFNFQVVVNGSSPNNLQRTYASGKHPKGVLSPPGGAPVNFSMLWSVPYEFKANGVWTEFGDAFSKDIYEGLTLTFKTKNSCRNEFGGLQGPYN